MIRREPPIFEFGGEVTLVRLALTRVSSLCLGLTEGTVPEVLKHHFMRVPNILAVRGKCLDRSR